MHEELQRAINLARRTGDRLIIFDKSYSSEPYVVMSLGEYEKIAVNRQYLLDLTEDELLDKINRDIAAWKSQEEGRAISIDEGRNFLSKISKKNSKPMTHIKDVVSGIPEFEEASYEKKTTKEKKSSPWSIPSDRKAAAEEVIEEDHQYLEAV